MNMNNFGVLRGRLVANPVTFGNADGSTKVKFSLACENNYKSKTTGKKEAQIIPVEAYVKSEYDKSPFARIGEGDKISAEISLRQNNYTDKTTGKMVYSTVVFVEQITFEESVAVTTQRRLDKAAKTAAPDVAAVAAAPVPAEAQVQA